MIVHWWLGIRYLRMLMPIPIKICHREENNVFEIWRKISLILPRESSVSHITCPNTMLNKLLLNNWKSHFNAIRTGLMTKEKIDTQNFCKRKILRPIQGQFSLNTIIYIIYPYNYISQVTLTDIHRSSKESFISSQYIQFMIQRDPTTISFQRI